MSLLTSLIPSLNPASQRSGAAEEATARRPYHEFSETQDGYTLTAYLPGVSKDALEITDEGGALRIFGRRSWSRPEGSTQLYQEISEGAFELVVTHDDSIATEKTQAELKDGILRVTLAKAESAKPRKIAVS